MEFAKLSSNPLVTAAEYGGYVTLAVVLAFLIVFVVVERSINRFNRATSEDGAPPDELPMIGSPSLRNRYREMSNTQRQHFWRRYKFVGWFVLLPFMVAIVLVWMAVEDVFLTLAMGLVLLALYYFAHSGGR